MGHPHQKNSSPTTQKVFFNTETPFQRLNDKQLYINEHCTNNDFDLSS